MPKAYNANASNLMIKVLVGTVILYYITHELLSIRIWSHSQLMQIYTDVNESRMHLLVYTILKQYKGITKTEAPFV